MSKRIHIAIAEPSIIITNGLISIIKQFSSLNIDIVIINEIDQIIPLLNREKYDILIINPLYLGSFYLQNIKEKDYNIKFIALNNYLSDSSILKYYDETISTYDSIEQIKEKIISLMKIEIEDDKQELSKREKEIVVCVVKGMTNKEIANKLFLSIHTILTHRRNISHKLQIHSASGLTIYAIVNKLVSLSEIKDSIA
ncbi:MAG: LuxR C-terminal-related transcriptional regulator [Bacteroidales bacterium]|jgi:DNA-binding NarL/FixJ family response regulator